MEKHMGPYRATKLWNESIRTFRNGMPVSRHRRYMKSYDDSFTPAEAIDWLHAQLQINPNFGPSVTRAQTLQLLEKFQKARVFEDVRGAKYQDTIGENSRLYRFSKVSPTKSRTPARPTRTPLAIRATANAESGKPATPATKLDFGKDAPPSGNKLNSSQLAASSRITRQEVEAVWKTLTLACLQKSLQLPSLNHILDSDFVNAQHIAHNMTHVNKNGVVCNIDKDDQLPYWVLSAMRCLAHWPNKVEDNLPDYPGFEKDVFKVVKDYFQGLNEPLLTFSMYEVFTNVFVCAENMGRPRAPVMPPRRVGHHNHPTVPGGITTFASVENLLMDLTMNGTQMLEDNEGDHESLEGEVMPNGNSLNTAFHPALAQHQTGASGARSCDPRVNGARPQLRRCNTSRDLPRDYNGHEIYRDDVRSAGGMRRHPSTTSMPVHANRLETSFGIDNAEPRTFMQTGITNSAYHSFYDVEHHRQSQQSLSGMYDQSRYVSSMSVDTHYGEDESFLHPEQKCLSTNDVSRIVPYPENGLARQHRTQTSYNSLSDPPSNKTYESDATYGYTVVLSTTPKSDHMRPRHNSASQVQHYRDAEQYTDNNHQHIYSDHDYYRRPVEPVYAHHQSSMKVPPPYVPPPSYQQFHRRAPSEHSSTSSYETAPSQPGSGNEALRPDEVYLEHEPRGKHQLPMCVQQPVLSGSYRPTHHGTTPFTTPFSNSHFSSRKVGQYGSLTSVHSPVCKNRLIEALRVCCLLLPPANRRKLHLLLRLMVKMSENEDLNIDCHFKTRDLVQRTFARCIVRSTEEADFDEILSLRLVYFMMDNYSEIMQIPEQVKKQIEDRISYLRQSKVSAEQFERQKMSNSQQALDRLLGDIVNDKSMADKDKKRRLKQFQKAHPDIYSRHFPAEPVPQPKKPRIKPALLSRPLLKLKSFRI